VQEELGGKEREKRLAAVERDEQTVQEMGNDRDEPLTNRQKRLLEMALTQKAELDGVVRVWRVAKVRSTGDARGEPPSSNRIASGSCDDDPQIVHDSKDIINIEI
jgi:hypothetical protein